MELAPGNARILAEVAVELPSVGRTGRAVELIDRAVRINPTTNFCWAQRVSLLLCATICRCGRSGYREPRTGSDRLTFRRPELRAARAERRPCALAHAAAGKLAGLLGRTLSRSRRLPAGGERGAGSSRATSRRVLRSAWRRATRPKSRHQAPARMHQGSGQELSASARPLLPRTRRFTARWTGKDCRARTFAALNWRYSRGCSAGGATAGGDSRG